ncbi:TPA: hypothetical protein N0F65_001224 [Lagenidium giganteum]|uniref:Dynactin subunit 6 n=1 Tax=Lagenidium giganteum TaxID=4803 RepID=A0AAV2Z5X1_9STRA|nr:TPA: hypothetical protein N0F65_001224 [Lagenidium giganteum]
MAARRKAAKALPSITRARICGRAINNPASAMSTQHLTIGPGSAVCEEAELRGTIVIGSQVIIHPNCRVLASAGPIAIGDRSIVEDHAVLENVGPEPMTIGRNNIFESGCVVRAAAIGDGNWFEPKAEACAGAVIGNNCVIGSGVVLEANERVPDNTIIVCLQAPQSAKQRIVRQQKDYLLKARDTMTQKFIDTFLDPKNAYALGKNHRLRRRRSRFVLRHAALLALVLLQIDARGGVVHAETEDSADDTTLRFQVPFPTVLRDGLDLEHQEDPSALLVRRVLAGKTTASCSVTASGEAASDCGTSRTVPQDEHDFPPVHVSDRIVAVDGVRVSLASFQEAIERPVGSFVVLPLFKPSADSNVNILSGFARVEILNPKMIELEPTTATRKAAIAEWQTAMVKLKQDQLQRELEEKERIAADENAKLEAEAQARRDKEERERVQMTPHTDIALKRQQGKEFRYEVIFDNRGPIGLNWDLRVQDKAVVSDLEPKLPAARANVIAAKDQLIQLNDVDTSAMGPYEVVQEYVQTSIPRRMVFLCAAVSVAAPVDTASLKPENWTVSFLAPAVLSGWHARVHIPQWSPRPKRTDEIHLALADPITACTTPQIPSALSSSQTPFAWISYRGGCSFLEKAEAVHTTRPVALLIINNVKGEGRFPTNVPVNIEDVQAPLAMLSKLDGELVMSVLEQDSPGLVVPAVPEMPKPLTNEELAIARNPAKATRDLTFWFRDTAISPDTTATLIFRVLPALFGGKIPTMPYRIVAAYPLETACHHQGLGILATRAVVLVKRGGCSFATKLRAVQTVGGAGMLLVNSDNNLFPLMSEKKETEGLYTWAATINAANGTVVQDILERNKNLPGHLNDTTRLAALDEGVHGLVDVLARVGGRKLHTDAREALWHNL